MSCYVRHLEQILVSAGIETTKENRKNIDVYLKEKFDLPVNASSCPDVWKLYVKPILNDDEQKSELIAELKILFHKK